MNTEWHIVPVKRNSKAFSIKNKEGSVVCKLIFPEEPDSTCLNLIACAPELEDIAEMFHDHMYGGQMQESIVFTIVRKMSDHLKPKTRHKT